MAQKATLRELSETVSALQAAWDGIQDRLQQDRANFDIAKAAGVIEKGAKFDPKPYELDQMALIAGILSERGEDVKEKLEGYLDLIQERECKAKPRRAEAARQADMARTDERLIESLKERIVWFFQTHEIRTMETPHYKNVRIQKNPGDIPITYVEGFKPEALGDAFKTVSTRVTFDGVLPDELLELLEAAGAEIVFDHEPQDDTIRQHLLSRRAILEGHSKVISEGNAELIKEFELALAEVPDIEGVILGQEGYHLRFNR